MSLFFVTPSDAGVSSVVVGALVVLLSLSLAVVLVTNRLIVTSAGLILWNTMRKRFIGWPEIRSFGVGPGRSVMRWPALVIRLGDGSATVTNLSSFTRTYPVRVAGELDALQRDLAPATLTGGDLHEGGSSWSAPSC